MFVLVNVREFGVGILCWIVDGRILFILDIKILDWMVYFVVVVDDFVVIYEIDVLGKDWKIFYNDFMMC